MIFYSLLFGFAAWGLGAAAIALRKRRSGSGLVFASFLCASVSAVWQFFEIQKRAYAGDWAAIEDTIRGIIFGVVVMLAVTLVLNGLALMGKGK